MATGRLAGKVALVTGATSGLGEAIARGYAREGAAVVLCGRRPAEGAAVVEAIRADGGRAEFIACDVADAEQVRALVAQTVAAFGRLDLAVNNAGIGAPGGKLADIEDDDFDQLIRINLRGVWLCMKHEIRQFLSQGGGGAIVNMGSVLGRVAIGAQAQYSAGHYVAAKHAIEGLTKTAAVDYGRDGLRVNTLAPGAVATAISGQLIAEEAPLITHWRAKTALGRLATVDDVVGAAIFLGSDESAYLTGTSLVVDGGFLAN
jgi:NAD(P)-dependent dehydrogenase (short-subunit alcohol dehydrogenase family)